MRFTILLAIVSIAAAACSCGSGLACCNSQCYNPSVYSCPTDGVTGNSILCNAGSQACNGACYNPTQYSCKNGGLAQGAAPAASSTAATPATSASSSSSSATTSCQTMFASLKCRTTSENPAQMDSNAIANSRAWLCGNYPQFCTAISSGGAYASCNSVEQLSYAMNGYYNQYSSQGASACNFGGVAALVSTATPTTSPSVATPATSASSNAGTSCQAMFASLSCRTASEDPSQVNAGQVSSSRNWLCSTYPQYCTAIVSGGQYSTCNTVEQISYAMNQYYLAVGPSQGASACSFSGLAQLVSAVKSTTAAAATPTTAAAAATTSAAASANCQTMFSQLTCRTTSEDPSQVDSSAVSGARSWLCSNYAQFCTAINSGGAYASCNSVEQLSYAMNAYYAAYGSSQGTSACNFGGVAKLVSAPAASNTATPVVNPTPSPSSQYPTQTADLRIINSCKTQLWFEARYGGAGAPLPGQSATSIQALPGSYVDYTIPDTGLSGTRFWAKYGCDNYGKNCLIGDQMQYYPNPPGGCPPGGCTPPVDSLFEATWGCRPGSSCNSQNPTTWFDTSQVDGWTIPYKLTPVGDVSGCDCIGSSCGFKGVDASTLDVTKCPSSEDLTANGQFASVNVLGKTVSLSSVDLRIIANGSILGCMSPCKRLNWGAPYGLQQDESSGSTMWMCCPTPTPQSCSPSNGCITPSACRAGPIETTKFVSAVHTMAPGVYSYSYDDGVGLHACPAGVTKYTMEFCPSGSAAYPGKA